MSQSPLPADVQALIGELQYEEEGEFPVERGYFWTSAASVENANPLFWDDKVADEISGGPVAPLSLLSAWFALASTCMLEGFTTFMKSMPGQTWSPSLTCPISPPRKICCITARPVNGE